MKLQDIPIEQRYYGNAEKTHGREVNTEQLLPIGNRLLTQDNRITKNPMFCVQEKRRLVGLDSAYAERRCWYDSANDYTIYDDDDGFMGPPTGKEWDEFGYIDQWFTVMVAFTEVGCEEYLRLNGHNHRGETRIYVESFNRCPEMILIREKLMEAASALEESK